MHLEQGPGLARDEDDLGYITLVASAVGRLESKVGELRAASVLVEAGGAAWQMLSLDAPEANILATARYQRLCSAAPPRGGDAYMSPKLVPTPDPAPLRSF